MDDITQPAAGEPAMPSPPPQEPPTERPSRKVIWIAAVVLVALVGALVAVTALDDGSAAAKTFDGHGVTFQYPGDWSALGPAQFEVETAGAAWTESFFSSQGINAVIVSEYALQQDASGFSEAQLMAELEPLLESSVEQGGGQILEPLSSVTVGDLSGFHTVFTIQVEGAQATTDMVLLFEGMKQFNIQCQYQADSEDEVMTGCRQVRDSFSLAG